MPKLILHTGIHKTGTTSLQKALFESRRTLATKGILYPETGLSCKPENWGHHELAYALRDAESARAVWSALRTEADRAEIETVLVSSEELSSLPFPSLPGIRPYQIIAECFEGYEIRLVCYLRPQAEVIGSLYNHHVKSVGETRSILDFMDEVAPKLEYAQYLNVAAVALGDAAIRVRRYDRAFLEGDIVSDFAAEIGFKVEPSFRRPKRNLNLGLTEAGMGEMLEANRRLADKPDQLARKRQGIIARHAAPPFQSHDPLNEEMRAVIAALYRFKNRQVARRFLKIDADLFDVGAAVNAPIL